MRPNTHIPLIVAIVAIACGSPQDCDEPVQQEAGERCFTVANLPRSAASANDIDYDLNYGAIGTRSELIDAIRGILPESDFSDPARGVLETAGYRIRFLMGCRGEITFFSMLVSGDSEGVSQVRSLLEQLNLPALDWYDGSVFQPGRSEAS
jgi:hypothetical protein